MNVDALSLLPIENEKRNECFQDDVAIFQIEKLSNLPVTLKEVTSETQRNPNLKILLRKLQTGLTLKDTKLAKYENEFSLENGYIEWTENCNSYQSQE